MLLVSSKKPIQKPVLLHKAKFLMGATSRSLYSLGSSVINWENQLFEIPSLPDFCV